MGIYLPNIEIPGKGIITRLLIEIPKTGKPTYEAFYDTEDGEASVKLDMDFIEVPTPHGRLKDADELYEKVAGWEAQALHMVEKAMHDEDNSEWKKWSVIATERSAFKFDVEDAPTVIEAEED